MALTQNEYMMLTRSILDAWREKENQSQPNEDHGDKNRAEVECSQPLQEPVSSVLR